jgi:hypothetical protein
MSEEQIFLPLLWYLGVIGAVLAVLLIVMIMTE